MASEKPNWESAFYAVLKQLHEALDVIETIDSECLLPPQLKDLVDGALAPRIASQQPVSELRLTHCEVCGGDGKRQIG